MNIIRKRRKRNMDEQQMKQLGLTSIEEYIAEDFGAEGTPERMEFEAGVDSFILGKD